MDCLLLAINNSLDLFSFRELKRASAPAGRIVEVPKPMEPAVPVEKADIPKDADSDFSDLNPLDDIDVTDQLIYKAPVRPWSTFFITVMIVIIVFIVFFIRWR